MDIMDRLRRVEKDLRDKLARHAALEGEVARHRERLVELGVEPPTVEEARKRLQDLQAEEKKLNDKIKRLLKEAEAVLEGENA